MRRKIILDISEDAICTATIQWSKYNLRLKDFLIHIANERKTYVQHHLKLKRMGVRKGVSDFFIALPMGSYCGLWVEVKKSLKKDTPKNREKKITHEQKEWINRMNSVGFIAVATFGLDETIKVFEQYLNDPDDIEIIQYHL